MRQEIGTAIIIYDKNGKVINAEFKSNFKAKLNEEILKEFSPVKDKEQIKQNADIALAGWFHQLSQIEYNENEDFKIESEISKCIKYLTGEIKECSINYFICIE